MKSFCLVSVSLLCLKAAGTFPHVTLRFCSLWLFPDLTRSGPSLLFLTLALPLSGSSLPFLFLVLAPFCFLWLFLLPAYLCSSSFRLFLVLPFPRFSSFSSLLFLLPSYFCSSFLWLFTWSSSFPPCFSSSLFRLFLPHLTLALPHSCSCSPLLFGSPPLPHSQRLSFPVLLGFEGHHHVLQVTQLKDVTLSWLHDHRNQLSEAFRGFPHFNLYSSLSETPCVVFTVLSHTGLFPFMLCLLCLCVCMGGGSCPSCSSAQPPKRKTVTRGWFLSRLMMAETTKQVHFITLISRKKEESGIFFFPFHTLAAEFPFEDPGRAGCNWKNFSDIQPVTWNGLSSAAKGLNSVSSKAPHENKWNQAC